MPDRAARALRLCAAGDLPANIALMHLLIEAASPEAAERLLGEALAASGEEERRRLAGLRDLWRATPQAWSLVRSVIAGVDHAPAGEGAGAVQIVAAAFDRAARLSPEGSVALYALGDPGLLAQATEEVVAWLRARGLVGREHRVLDLGCGIGRFAAALSGEVRHVTGIDVSGEMIREAGRRLAARPNVRLVQVSGRDLSGFPDQGFDLVLAVDSFPYLVQAGEGLAATHVREAARVLGPGGSLVILNYAYGGDAAADRAAVNAHAAACGFVVREAGTRPFRLWDGLAFHLHKPA